MQEIKGFIQGIYFEDYGKNFNPTPIPDQINEYLREHPNRTAKSICAFVGAGYKEAFVIFDDVSTEDHKNGNVNGTDDRRTAGTNPDRRNEKIINNKGVKNNGKN